MSITSEVYTKLRYCQEVLAVVDYGLGLDIDTKYNLLFEVEDTAYQEWLLTVVDYVEFEGTDVELILCLGSKVTSLKEAYLKVSNVLKECQ